MPNAVTYKGRTVNIGTIPIGIDPEKFTDVPLLLFPPPLFFFFVFVFLGLWLTW